MAAFLPSRIALFNSAARIVYSTISAIITSLLVNVAFVSAYFLVPFETKHDSGSPSQRRSSGRGADQSRVVTSWTSHVLPSGSVKYKNDL